MLRLVTIMNSLSFLNWPLKMLERVRLYFSTIGAKLVVTDMGWTTLSSAATDPPPASTAAVTGTPAKTADQAAGLVWFIESRPRVALGWMAAVKMSSRRQSFVGKVSGVNAAPVCKAQSSIV